MNIPGELSRFLAGIERDFPPLLGSNLVGIYLWGSLTYNAFDEHHSDLDCIVLTERDLDEREFTGLRHWFHHACETEAWARKLDLRFVINHEFLDKSSRCCQFHSGEFVRTGSDGNPLIWINLKESGITIWGTNAKRIAPDVSAQCLQDALLLELAYLIEDITANAGNASDDAFQHLAYAVLTACRIAYTASHGTLVSKQRAFDWALETLPVKWHPLVIAAEENRRRQTGAKSASEEAAALAFVRFIDSRTRKSLVTSGDPGASNRA